MNRKKRSATQILVPVGGGLLVFVLLWLMENIWVGLGFGLVWALASFFYLRTHYGVGDQAAEKLHTLLAGEPLVDEGMASVLTKDNKELAGAYVVTNTKFVFDRGTSEEPAAEVCLDFAELKDIKAQGRYLQLVDNKGDTYDFKLPLHSDLALLLGQLWRKSRQEEEQR